MENKNAPNLKASSLSTGGSMHSTMLVGHGKAELGHGSSLEVISAHEGIRPFKKKTDVWQVFSWTCFMNPMVALADSGLTNVVLLTIVLYRGM